MKKGIRRALAGVLAGIMIFSSGGQMISAGDVTGAQLFSDGADVIIDEPVQNSANSAAGTASVTPSGENSVGEVELFSDTFEPDAAQTTDIPSDTGEGSREGGAVIQFTDAQDVGEGGTDPAEDPVSGTSADTSSESDAEVSPTPSPQQGNTQESTGAEDLEDISDGGQFTDNGHDPSPSDNQTQQVTNWSGSKNFLFSLTGVEKTPEGAWQLSLEFAFSEISVENPVKTGDMVTLSLPVQWMNISDTGTSADICPVIRRNDENGEITEEKLDTKIAEYRILNGVLELRFTEGIEAEEIVQQLSQLHGELEIPFIWKEDTRTEENQEAIWTLQTYEDGTTNEAKLVIPAVQQDGTEPVEEGQNGAGQEGETETDDPETSEEEENTSGETAGEEESSEEAGDEEEIDIEMADTEEELPEESDVYIEEEEEQAAGTGELQPETAALSLFSAGVSTLADSSYPMSSQKYEGKSEERHIYWIDNNDGQKTRPSFSQTISDADKAKLRFSATFTYKENNVDKTVVIENLTWDEVKTTTSTISMTNLGGTGHWVLSASNLLSSANVTIDGTSRAGTFSDWTINTADDHVFANDQYASVYVTSENTEGIPEDQDGNLRPSAEDRRGWFYVQELDYTSEIHLRTGTKTTFTDEELENLKNAILAEYSFFWKTGITGADGNDLNSGSTPLDASPNWMTITWDDKGDHLVGTVTVPDLEKYNLDGSELIFYVDGDEGKDVKITVAGMEDGDYLAESVVNDDVSNWGTNTTEVYSGGDLILTLTGTTEYTATKEWHDKADSSDRPQVDFYLWRFTDKGTETDIDTAYQTAAAVKATNGEHRGQTAQVTIQAQSTGDSFDIDFSKNFLDEDDTQTMGYLPKYDPEGYRYVYICREYMTGDSASRYETEYGKLENGSFVDTLPTGYNGDRTAYDNSIYNGGTVSNLLTGTTTAPVTKTWVANAFQSELEDTIVELTLYSRVKTADDSETWEKTTTTYRMGESTPFIAEFLTQSHSVTVPKYSNEGEELQYCWVETGVYQENDPTKNLLDPSPSTTDKTFTLSQNGQTVNYKSQSEYSKNTDGTYSTTITNRIEDTTNYYVRKDWDSRIPDTDKNPVSLRMYRTGINNKQQHLSTTINETTDFKLDGVVDAEPTPLYYDGKQVGQVQETSEWYAEYTNLDKYDANGSQYDFIVFEGNPGSWKPEYSTAQDDQGNTIRVITNRPGPGTDITLYLRKRWLDDGDEQHRGKVTYTIYNIPAESRGNITKDVLSDNGVQVATAEISREDEWWKQVYLSNVTDSSGILVLETSVASTDANGEPVTINNYTDDQLNEIFKLQHASSDTSGTAPYVSYETTYHRYEASYSMVNFEGNKFYTVTNRRLGNIDIEVTKTWKDGSTADQISEQRQEFLKAIGEAGYELVFQLVSNSSEVKVDYENNTVTAGNEAVPILKADGTTKAEAIQKLYTDTNTSVYEFYNLPKYDAMGRMVSYSVKEMLRPKNNTDVKALVTIDSVINEKKIDTDYSFTITQSGYTVSDGHQHDKQMFSAVNQLTGSKDVFFWKEWNDAYRYKLGERPDLYLDLYQVKHNEDGTEKIPESLYLDRRWQFKDEWISLCDFGSMPKYDEFGFEIIYYAQEKILINKEAFDYTDVYYKYSTEMEDKDVLAGGQASALEDLNEHVNGLSKIGDEKGRVTGSSAPANAVKANEAGTYLLKEYGIFVNELQADVVFNGKKIWANIPSGFLEEDLAPVTFRLYQFVSGNEPDNSSNTQSVDKDGKYFLTGEDETQSPEYASITIEDWSKQKYNGEYVFAIKYQGENTNTVESDGNITVSGTNGALTIPKYDEDGNLYAYVMRESGDFSGTDVADDHSLIFKQPTINNYAITNPYESDKGTITLKKLLDTRSYTTGTVKDPSVSFTLTRQYTKTGKEEDGTNLQDDTAFSKTEIIKYSEFAEGKAEISFTDLEIYAPNGMKYVYTVTENVGSSELLQGGYTVSAGVGNLDKDSEDLKECAKGEYKVTGLYPKQEDLEQEPDPNPDTSYATFSNKYDTYLVPLYFGKNWGDLNNKAGVRPKSLTFGVQREAASQPGQNNGISNQVIGNMKITISDNDWNNNTTVTLTEQNGGLTLMDNSSGINYNLGSFITKVTVSSKDETSPLSTASGWIIKVESVPDFAPNGMPWTYKLQEKLEDDVWKYTGTGLLTLNYVAPTGNEQYGHFGNETSPSAVTNSLSTSTKFWKNWRYDGAVNQKFKNPLGYAMELDVSLYFAAVELDAYGGKPSDEDFNDAVWRKVEEETDFYNALNEYYKSQTGNSISRFVKTISYTANSELGVKSGASSTEFSTLPKVVKVGDHTYAMRYYAIETALRLKDSSTVIYVESFTPNFEKLSDQAPDAAKKYGGTSRVGYWLKTEAKIIDSNGNLSGPTELLVTPRVDSKEDLDRVWDQGFYQVFDSGIDLDTDKTVWPVVNYDDSKRESTNINDLDLTKLDVKKTWKNDSGNIYGTREPNGISGWKLTFQLQRVDVNKKDPQDADWQSVAGNTVTVTGSNSTGNGTGTFTYLPVKVLEKNAAGGYSITEYRYRARELDDENVVENDGTYRDAYKATYADEGTADDGYTTSATNTMITIDLHAQKNWNDTSLTSPVTLELQYQSGTDGEGTPILESFDTPAKVTLDGSVNTSAVYYEYDSWKAKWTGVPKVMPGSVTTGDNTNKQTVYRVVEVTENAYGTDRTGNALTGTGTQDAPYVLENPATDGDAYTITNELTKLKVEKIVEKYVDGVTATDEFTLKISGDMSGITVKYQKYTKAESQGAQDEEEGSLTSATISGNSFNFTLKDNQYVIIYGLKKGVGVTYTVTETDAKGYTPSYQVTAANSPTPTEGSSVIVPETKPSAPPTVTVTNKKYGKLTVEKEDESGKPLSGVTFQLKSSDYKNGPWDDVTGGVKTTGADGNADGKVVYENLKLKKYYQITETAVPSGYNKLGEPVVVYLPFETTSNQSGSNPLYTVTDGTETKYYYADVTITIGNNKTLVMPTTAGNGFFWPGLFGPIFIIVVIKGYLYSGRRRRRKSS